MLISPFVPPIQTPVPDFYGNIAAGDLDVFAFATHSSAANSRNRAVSAAGLCIYRAALNGNVFAVTLKAAANACCFATGYRRYITIANRNILTRRALTSANACTPVTAVGLDRTTFNNNIAGIFYAMRRQCLRRPDRRRHSAYRGR